ncbi:MAG: hypothetical protein PW843_29145 [Azospirillaceae bacterium]|nr:hypothetical protein [Azospirillaceae bacterium]
MKRRKVWAAALLPLLMSGTAWAADPLAPLDFLIGHWQAPAVSADSPDQGGTFDIGRDLGGTVLVRHDHIRLKDGGAMDMLMLVYPEAGGLRADFFDTAGHVIHYQAASVTADQVTFLSDGTGPTFRLTYSAVGKENLRVRFEIKPPGGDFKVFTEGMATRG